MAGLSSAERDLLLAAAGLTGAEQFQPGVLASGLPFVVPAFTGRTVVGSMLQPNMTIVVVRTSLMPEVAQNVALGTLKKAGWLDQYPTSATSREVFQNTDLSGQVYVSLCRPGVTGQLNVTSVPWGRGAAQVTYRLNQFSGMDSACPANQDWNDPKQANYYSPERTATYRDPLQDLLDKGLKLPSLAAPAGAQLENSGSSYSESEYSTYSKVYTTQTAAQILAHYTAALRAQGWVQTAVTPLNTEQIVRFRYRQGTVEREGMLALMPRPELGRTRDGRTQKRYDVKLELRLK